MGIVVDLNVIFMAEIQTLQILAHDHQVDVVEASAGNQRTRRAQVREQLELLPQAHVGGSVTAARRRLERTLQGEPSPLDALDGLGRQGIARGFDGAEACDLRVPFERRTERLEDRERRLDDFGTDPVARDQSGWD